MPLWSLYLDHIKENSGFVGSGDFWRDLHAWGWKHVSCSVRAARSLSWESESNNSSDDVFCPQANCKKTKWTVSHTLFKWPLRHHLKDHICLNVLSLIINFYGSANCGVSSLYLWGQNQRVVELNINQQKTSVFRLWISQTELAH